jgi:hypothetical protein
MVHWNDGQVAGESQRLCEFKTDQKATDQPGPLRDGNPGYVVHGAICFSQNLPDNVVDRHHVGAGSEFGHHAAEAGVERDLRVHDAGAQLVRARQ